MTALVDTSILVDHLRGKPEATGLLSTETGSGLLHASEVTRLELLAGMRAHEEEATNRLLQSLVWHPVDRAVAEEAGRLGCRWLPDHRGMDGAALAIAATARLLGARLLTLNVRHFPMFTDLRPPY